MFNILKKHNIIAYADDIFILYNTRLPNTNSTLFCFNSLQHKLQSTTENKHNNALINYTSL
jgi:hypothetical protein